MDSSILSTLQQWLVNHPKIRNFQWTPGATIASTPQFLALTVFTYLSLTLLLSRSSIFSLPNSLLKPITAVHSLILSLLSLIMAVGCLLSIFSLPKLRHVICFPPNTPPRGPLFFWAYIFYLSKLLEFGDTLLIILGKSIKRLTFLHVYHHATVLVMCYLWLRTKQSLFPVALVTNTLVHVFVFSFGVSVLMLYYHFTGVGCSGILGWCFNAVFNASLLALFFDFHGKSYANKRVTGAEDKYKRQ